MSSVEGGRLSEEPEPERKRHGEGCESEEEPKQQKVDGNDEDDDPEADFYEADSDHDEDKDDFVSPRPGDGGYWWEGDATAGYLDKFDKKEYRGCLHKSLCNMYQHKSEFHGLHLFELFKVKLKFNDKVSTAPLELCGAIEHSPIDGTRPHLPPVFITYYWVSEKQPDLINLNSDNNMTLLTLSYPETRSPIFECDEIAFIFYFKLNHKDVFKWGTPRENHEIFYDGCGNHAAKYHVLSASTIFRQSTRSRQTSPYITRKLIGDPDSDPIIFAAYYSTYYGAWATVCVEILKEGVSSFSGFIYARPCIFRSRIRLLSVPSNQKVNLEESGSVKLARSVVAVPSYASLIIAAVLNDQDGKQIIRGKTFFPASEKGTESKYIEDNDGLANLKVTVKWSCKH